MVNVTEVLGSRAPPNVVSMLACVTRGRAIQNHGSLYVFAFQHDQSSDFPFFFFLLFAIDNLYVFAGLSDGGSEGSDRCRLPAAHRTPQANNTSGGSNGQSPEQHDPSLTMLQKLNLKF